MPLRTPWRPIAIVLAMMLALILICVALVLTDVVNLAESLL